MEQSSLYKQDQEEVKNYTRPGKRKNTKKSDRQEVVKVGHHDDHGRVHACHALKEARLPCEVPGCGLQIIQQVDGKLCVSNVVVEDIGARKLKRSQKPKT